jgi:hypothetical protein
MNSNIKNILSTISLVALLTGTSVMASEGDADYVSLELATPVTSVHQESNPVLGEDLESDAFTYNSSSHVHMGFHKVSILSEDNIPAGTIFWDPLYYSTNN